MENFDYPLWSLVVAILAIGIPYLVSLVKKKFFNPRSIKITFKKSFKNESRGEPFIEFFPVRESKKVLTIMPYLSSEVYIKNKGETDFFLDEFGIQFRSLGAPIVADKITYKSSFKLEKGQNLTITYTFDLREEYAYEELQACNMRFKVTELSGKIYYSEFFKPEIEFNNVEIQ